MKSRIAPRPPFRHRLKRNPQPCALTIAGSDSGGGAGIQADLKTFASLGVHGTTAITCLTAQNPVEVRGLEPCRPKFVRQQIEAVIAELPPSAIKTGMLFSSEVIREVARFFRRRKTAPLVVDPVMVATSGSRLLEAEAVAAMQEDLLPLATLVTPNLYEAEILTGLKLQTAEDLRTAAKMIRRNYGCAVLIKGGHLKDSREAIDIYYDGSTELLLVAPFIRNVSTHGTGCTYSAAISGYLALGYDLSSAVQKAKHYITQAIADSRRVDGHFVLNSFWKTPGAKKDSHFASRAYPRPKNR